MSVANEVLGDLGFLSCMNFEDTMRNPEHLNQFYTTKTVTILRLRHRTREIVGRSRA